MKYYKEAYLRDNNQVIDEFNNVIRQYDKKYDENKNLKEVKIYEYEYSSFIRESSVPTDEEEPVIVSSQIGNKFERLTYIKGNLAQYVSGHFRNGKKEIDDIFNYDSQTGLLRTYYKNSLIKDGRLLAEEKYEFNEYGKLLNLEHNVEI
jgi:hypothetical protein